MTEVAGMGIFRLLPQWAGRLFRIKGRFPGSFARNDRYVGVLTRYLESYPRDKPVVIRKTGNGNFWKGEVLSMMDAYLFLINLPSVRIGNIIILARGDSLIYRVIIGRNQQIVMHERFFRGRTVADIKLKRNKVQQLRIRLFLKDKV